MKLNPFRAPGARRQTPRELRAENTRLTAELAAANTALAESNEVIRTVIEEREFFHEMQKKETQRAAEAEIVVGCLEGQLAEERQKVDDLEAIAGPHVPATETESPIYSEVTSEHPLPAFTEKYPAPDFSDAPAADSEDTVQIPLVKTLTDALVDA